MPSMASPSARSRRNLFLFAACILLALYLIALVRTAWLSDDAWITWRTIQNWLEGYGLRWNIAERVQTYTHPLWLLLITPLAGLTGNYYLSNLILSIALSFAAFAIVLFAFPGRPAARLLGAGTLLLSDAFVDYSTSGLENPLTHLLVVAFVLILLDSRGSARSEVFAESPAPQGLSAEISLRRVFLASLFAGLAVLNRLDTLLLFAPALTLLLLRRFSIRALGAMAVGFLPFIAWEMFSIIYYGFPFPNTAYAKLGHELPLLRTLAGAADYFTFTVRNDPVTIIGLIVAIVLAAPGRDPRRWAVVAGAALYLIYIIRIGGDFMGGRFFAAPLLMLVSLLASRVKPLPRFVGPGAAILILIVGFIPRPPSFIAPRASVSAEPGTPNGVIDERAVYFPYTGLFGSGYEDYAPTLEGEILSRNAVELAVVSMAGHTTLALAPERRIIDVFALTDPLLARLPARAPQQRIGHYWREIPDGYIRTLLFGRNLIDNPHLREFYESLQTIVAGPIWSGARWRHILNMNLGRYDDLLARGLPADPPGELEVRADASQHFRYSTLAAPDPPLRPFFPGIRVWFEEPRHDPLLVAELNPAEDHVIALTRNDRILAAFTYPAQRAAGEVAQEVEVQAIILPEEAVQSGYESIAIMAPRGGIEDYRLGRLRLLTEIPTSSPGS